MTSIGIKPFWGERRLEAAGLAWMGLMALIALAARFAEPLEPLRAAVFAMACAAAGAVLTFGPRGWAAAAFGCAFLVGGAALGYGAAPALAAMLLPYAALRGASEERIALQAAALAALGFVVGAFFCAAPIPGLSGVAMLIAAGGAALSAPFWDAAAPRASTEPTAGEAATLRARIETLEAEAKALRAGLTARAGDLGHELRTPIGHMVSYADMVRFFGPLNDNQSKYIDIIQEAGRSALRLATWLMDFAQIESGRFGFEPGRFDVRPLGEDVVRMMAVDAARKEQTLALEAPATPLTVEADDRAVRQIMQNLLVNVVKFTPSGGRALLRLRAEGGDLLIEAEDSGPGIAEAERDRLTERFARGAAARAGVDGVGLGLALVRGFADLHGGKVSFHDGPTLGGALVRVRLPVVVGE